MSNFLKISSQTKKLSIHVFDSDRSVCMTAMVNAISPISAVLTNDKFPGGKKRCAKF